MPNKTLAALVGCVVVGVGVVVWLGLRGDDAPPSEPPPVEPALTTAPFSDEQMRRLGHVSPWPHEAFAEDIRDLKSPSPEGATRPAYQVVADNWIALREKKVTLRMESATAKQVVQALSDAFADTGVRIYTLPPDMSDEPMDILVTDGNIITVLDYIKHRYPGVIHEYMTTEGLCIGTEFSIQQAQIDANQANARAGARRDRDAAILDKPYRPDLVNAHVGAVARDVKEKTGVEVVVDAEIWTNGKSVTWRASEMPLRDALDRLCDKIGAYYRVKDERVFLLAP